jgi:hypothetical protein
MPKKLPSDNLLTTELIQLSLRQRFNPIKTIDAEKLSNAHDAFDRGQIKDAALMWEVIEDRDDLVKAVAAKRKKNIARNGFEIVTFCKEGAPEYKRALEQKAVLQNFYDKLLVTHAVDQNDRGGFKLLVRQMMDAVGKRYAVHEIVWNPQPTGLQAELRFVPLWFFENITGQLRFLTTPTATTGVDLKPGAWMVTTSDGIMKACAIAWMRKNLALGDWGDYSGDYGKPGIIASTTAARGSTAFDTMQEALDDFLDTKAMVTNSAETIKVIDLASTNPPFEPLVERMDRLISALWRGSDLSTISKSQGYGASVQQGETQILEEDDCEMITENLQKNLDARVIEYTFGPAEPVLAGVTVQQTPRRGTQQDMIIDNFLIAAGMSLSVNDAAKRYGRAIADPGEALLKPTSIPIATDSATTAADAQPYADPNIKNPGTRSNPLDQTDQP